MSKNRHDPVVTDDWDENGGGRPRIDKTKTHKFVKGDKVNMQVGRHYQGPYVIERVVRVGEYTLADEDGNRVNNGAIVEERVLTFAV